MMKTGTFLHAEGYENWYMAPFCTTYLSEYKRYLENCNAEKFLYVHGTILHQKLKISKNVLGTFFY